jgi:hypothetical protein
MPMPPNSAQPLTVGPGVVLGKRRTPAARALVGCQALATDDKVTLPQALALAGYSTKLASRVHFSRGRCFVPIDGSGVRVVVRNGRIVRVSRNAHELAGWMLRLGRKLAVIAERAGRRAA